MKKTGFIRIMLLTCLVAALAYAGLVLTTNDVLAGNGKGGKPKGYTLHSAFECQLSPRHSGLPDVIVTNKSIAKVYDNGKATLKCIFENPYPPPTSTTIITGFSCGTHNGPTTDSKLVIKTSGKIIMTCTLPAPEPGDPPCDLSSIQGAYRRYYSGVVNPDWD
jgi:hypothetical protein